MSQEEFCESLLKNAPAFDIVLSESDATGLSGYYELVTKHNPLLHLVAPCTPADFAVRHVLESLSLIRHLPQRTTFADAGTGAGLPSIPCLIVRPDLKGILIENKERKTAFLREAVEQLGLAKRAAVAGRQFEEVDISKAAAVTCRAIDKFTEKLPRMLRWAKGKRILLFGGNNLAEALSADRVRFRSQLMPLSQQRFLFIVTGK